MPQTLHRVLLIAVIFAGAGQAQSMLTGRVTAVSDGERIPAAGAWVVASSGAPPRIVATAPADEQGIYRLEGLPEGRVEFTISQRGYFTLASGGAAAATLARTCPANGSCGEADFVVAKASVVEGYVTDPFGDPLADAAMVAPSSGSPSGPTAAPAISDSGVSAGGTNGDSQGEAGAAQFLVTA